MHMRASRLMNHFSAHLLSDPVPKQTSHCGVENPQPHPRQLLSIAPDGTPKATDSPACPLRDADTQLEATEWSRSSACPFASAQSVTDIVTKHAAHGGRLTKYEHDRAHLVKPITRHAYWDNRL